MIPREDGKRIEEFVGAATTGTESVSVARMLAPPGWTRPAQTPEFDEVVVVLTGELTLVVNGKRERIAEGEVGWCPGASAWCYRNDAAGRVRLLVRLRAGLPPGAGARGGARARRPEANQSRCRWRTPGRGA